MNSLVLTLFWHYTALAYLVLKMNCKELYNKKDEKYEDIFSGNIGVLKNISTLLQKVIQVREELLDTN